MQGYVHGAVEPVIREGVTDTPRVCQPDSVGHGSEGIVVSVSVTAFALALTQRLYKKYGTINIDEMTLIARNEKERRENLMLPWYYNIPLFNILGVLAMAILSPLIKNRRTVRYLTCVLFAVSGIFNLILTFILLPQNESFVYHAGFFAAPWATSSNAAYLKRLWPRCSPL